MGDFPGSFRIYFGSMGAAQYLIFLPVLGSIIPALSSFSAAKTFVVVKIGSSARFISKPVPMVSNVNTPIKPKVVKRMDFFINRFMTFFPFANEIHYPQESGTKAMHPKPLQVLHVFYTG